MRRAFDVIALDPSQKTMFTVNADCPVVVLDPSKKILSQSHLFCCWFGFFSGNIVHCQCHLSSSISFPCSAKSFDSGHSCRMLT